MLKYNIIPKPNNYTSKDGTYVISSNTEVLCSPEFVSAGRYLTDYLKTKPVKGEGAIKFQKVAGMENEAYSISVSTDGIMIKASSSSGAFYGAVTLKTIIMQAEKTDGRAVINGLYISDKPAFKYRGFMLDECRHFFGTEAVKTQQPVRLIKPVLPQKRRPSRQRRKILILIHLYECGIKTRFS